MPAKKDTAVIPTRPKCPFFRWAEGREILCKGSCLPESDEIHRFRFKDDMKMQYETFCCDVYERCPGYQTIKHWHWDIEEEERDK